MSADQARPSKAPLPETAERIIDPRAVRVSPAPASSHATTPPVVLEPPARSMSAGPHLAGTGILGGTADHRAGDRRRTRPTTGRDVANDGTSDDRPVNLVDGAPTNASLHRLDDLHSVLEADDGTRIPVLLMPPDGPTGRTASAPPPGTVRREIVVDGWRVEVDIESERRAALRERARRARSETARGGPTEVHAIIPGQVVAVSVVPGDAVVAGQQLLVVEAMKMQNELRAPRDGLISQVAVGTGTTIEVGDLLLVLE